MVARFSGGVAIVPRDKSPAVPPAVLTPHETARYTADMIESLRKIALKQGQLLLAHFLELAALEAKAQASQDQDTRLPE
jgi:hypothetical protein